MRAGKTKAVVLFGCGAAMIVALTATTRVSASYIVLTLATAVAAMTAATLARSWLTNLLVGLASLAVGLAAIEAICLPLRQTIQVFGNEALIAQGPPLGWSLKAGTHAARKTVNGKAIYAVTYGVDPKTHRVVTDTSSGPGVAFVGDSFTFGEGLNDADTWPQAFADLLDRKTPVANLGVPAYSPAQVLRELQLGLYDDVLSPAKAFVFLTAAWHADRVACKQDFVVGAPRFVRSDGALRYDGPCPPLHHTKFERFFAQTATYQLLIASRRLIVDADDIATYIAVVSEAARVAKNKYHVPLIIVYLRNAGYLHFTGYTDDDILRALHDQGVEAVDMTLPNEGRPEVIIAGDGHSNGAGNRMRAKILKDYMEKTHPDLIR